MNDVVNPGNGGTTVQEAANQLAGLLDGREEETTEEVETEVEETEESETEDLDESEESEVEDQEADDAEPEEGSEETEDPIETLDDVAEAMGVPLEDLQQSLTHTFKAAGEEVTVTLSELVKGYQKDADYRRQTSELSEQRKAFDAERQEYQQSFQQQAMQQAAVLNGVEQMLMSEMNSDEMAQLRQSNESAWVAKRLEFQDRAQKLTQIRQEAANQYAQQMQQFQEQQQKELQEYRAKEMEALQSKLTLDDATRKAITNTAVDLGLSKEEVMQITDHRLIVGLHELHQLREQAKNAETVTKKVRKLPKLQKPGKVRSAKQQRSDRELAMRNKLRASGKVEDAAAILAMRMEGN